MPKRKGPMKGVQRGVAKANVSLKSMAAVLDQQSQTLQQIQDSSSQVQDDRNGGSSVQLIAIQIARAQLSYQKESNDYLKKMNMSANKQIEALQKSNKDWKGFGDKFKDFKGKMSDAFDINTIKKKLLGPFSMFKGARDKMDDLDYVKRMKALGSTKSTKELKADAVTQRGARDDALRAQDKISRLKKMGATDQQINASDAGKQRASALNTYNQLNQVDGKSARDAANPMGGNVSYKSAGLAQLPSDQGKVSQSTTDLLAEQQAAHENQVETLKNIQAQTDLLSAIAANTAIMAGRRSSSAGGAEDAGLSASGGRDKSSTIFAGIGDAMSSIGRGVGGLGKGIGGAIGGVFSGIMQGIADGIAAIGSAKTLKGIAAVGLLAGVLYGFGQSLDSFSQLDWDTINTGLITIGAVVAATALAGKFADKIIIGAGALGIMALAIGGLGLAFNVVADSFNNFVDGIDRLSKIGFDGLVGVAGGLMALSAAMAAFGAGQAAAGLGTLIGNLLTIGQDSPIAQLQQLANMGDSLNGAAKGIDSIGQAMVGFSKVDKSAIDALNDFPWIRATAFVAAGGAMSVAGGSVYATSKTNADTQAKVDGQGKGGTAVIAPSSTVNNSNQTNVIKPPVRNSESSYNKYLSRRFA
jgi:hypothetical protein